MCDVSNFSIKRAAVNSSTNVGTNCDTDCG